MRSVLKLIRSKELWFLLLCGLIVVFTRVWNIQSVPSAISHDEISYTLNAHSVAITGKGITGEWNPLSLTPVHTDFAELPAVIMAPFFLLPVSSVVAAKLPFILMSLILPGVMFFIAQHIFHSKQAAIFAALITAFNPWIWQFSRLTFDAYFSLFFFLCGTAIFISQKQWKQLFSLPLFFLAFYQYQGHKLVFLPWIFLWGIYLLATHQKGKKTSLLTLSFSKVKVFLPTLTVLLLSTGLFIWYIFFQLPQQSSVDRLHNIITPKHATIVQEVAQQRQISLQYPINRWVVNNYTVWGETMVNRFIEVYSPRRLFWEGQGNNSAFSVWTHGTFYLIDALLIVFGAYALQLSKKDKSTFRLILFGLLLAPIPALLAENQWYVFRASLAIPFLILFAGKGAEYIWNHWPKIFVWAGGVLYVISILNFAYIYFVRYPIYSAERHYFTEKILSEYVQRTSPNTMVHVLTPEPEFTFKTYLHYNNLLTSENAQRIQNAFKNKQYQLDSVEFVQTCLDMSEIKNTTEPYIVRADTEICNGEKPLHWGEVPATQAAILKNHLTLPAVKDSGEVYAIFGDQLCLDIPLGSYLRIVTLDQLNPSELSDEELCRTWITDTRKLENE